MVNKMKNTTQLIFISLILSFLIGCGGGGGGATAPSGTYTTETAYFIDSAVEGVNYTCGDINGTTDSTGKFTYDSGKCSVVTFKLGNLTLGSIAPNSINTDDNLTIQDLVGVERTNLTDATVLKIATLLQSLDNDGNATNGIKIDVNVSSLSGTITSISDINSSITILGKTVKTESEVKAHLETSATSIGVVFDRTPTSFSFTSQTNVSLNTEVNSNQIKITGINTATSISIANGYYKINNGGWTDQNGTIFNDDNVTVKHTTINDFNQTKITTLNIGGVNGTFSSTTKVASNIPDDFNFENNTSVNLSAEIISNTVQIKGIDQNISISVSNGDYKINNGNWMTSSGTVAKDDNVTLRHTSSSSYDTNKTTSLTVGTITKAFTSTTRKANTIPNSFNFENNLTAPLNSTITSNSVTILGLEAPTTISISSGSYYSINNSGNWTDQNGTIDINQTVQVRHTSHTTNFETNTTTTLTIGGVIGTFTSKTIVGDSTPDQFTFMDQSGVAKKTYIEANVTITGINTSATISIVGGEYSLNGGTWTSTNGTVSNNQVVTVRHLSSQYKTTETNTTLTVGGVSDTFTSTTDATAFIMSGNFLIGKPIVGVQYSCKDDTRETDSNGTFSYSIDECNGSPIIFKLKNLILGSLNSNTDYDDKNVTLQEILDINKSVINNPIVSKTAILLTSLDSDNDLTNGIEISSGDLANILLEGNISTIPDANITAEIVVLQKVDENRKIVVKSKFDALKYVLEGTKSMGISTTELVTYPENGATNIGTYPVLKVAFGERMNSGTVTNGANIQIGTHPYQFAKKDYNDTLMMAVYKEPDNVNAVIADTNLTITLTSGIQNIKNQGITEYKVSFIPTAKNIQPKLKTGQTVTSYNELGNSDSSDYVKDDSYYSSSTGTNRSFIRDDISGTVIDSGTNLQWEDSDNSITLKKTFTEAKNYCDDLTLSGYDNWRLPTIKEFALISDKGKTSSPMIFSTFTKVVSSSTDAYWSSDDFDPEDVNTSSAFRFDTGRDGFADHNESSTLNVRCVREIKTTPYGEYIRDDVNGIVVDTSSGYMWQDNLSYTETTKPWINTSDYYNPSNLSAIKMCEDLTLGGYIDWRLPNFNELLSIVDRENYDTNASPKIYIPATFKNKIGSWYWSSTTDLVGDPTADLKWKQAWIINFADGDGFGFEAKDKNTYTRCVRGN